MDNPRKKGRRDLLKEGRKAALRGDKPVLLQVLARLLDRTITVAEYGHSADDDTIAF